MRSHARTVAPSNRARARLKQKWDTEAADTALVQPSCANPGGLRGRERNFWSPPHRGILPARANEVRGAVEPANNVEKEVGFQSGGQVDAAARRVPRHPWRSRGCLPR